MHMKNMKKILIPLFGTLLAALPATAPAAAPAASVPVTVLDAGPQSSWRVFIGQDGAIESYESLRHGVWQRVPFRSDIKAGPAWEGVTLSQPTPGVARFTAEQDGILYDLSYEAAEDHIVVKARLENRSQKEFAPLRSRLHLGIDSDMKSYPEWNDKFFPTLMRCEKSHFWGYFMSPESRIMAVCTSDPVASYGINYIYEEILKWKWGHQIFTGSLDLLHAEPLPARHPHDLGALAPGQSREWTIHMGEIDNLGQLKPTLAAWGDIPMVECDRYTLLEGESTGIQLFGEGAERARISVTGPDGAAEPLEGRTFKPSKGPGEYVLTITAPNGKQAEARVYVRNNWSWYQRHARDFVAKYPPFMSGAESIYGYYVAFRAGRHFPDPEKSEPLIERFDKMLDKAWDTVAWKCRTEFMPYRIQNHTTMIGILIDLWRLTGEENYLRQASHIGDYICSDAVQSPDGAYRSNKIHYTAVIYPAKSMLELASAEREAADATGSAWWDEAARRHGISASRACADLLLRRDDIETEGDMTFEDGMVSCAALQLALYALTQDDPAQRAAYTAAAEYIYQKHRCLQQTQIPDARMRGATLRYWEILDIYFAPNQVMNSPHGWTSWKTYASYYLYLLTGQERYLRETMDTLGASAQVINTEGRLRWGFIPDPYVHANVFVEDPEHPTDGIPTDSIVGEQYLDMITPWHRPAGDDTGVFKFSTKGGQGDFTVFETFKAMEECALQQAYVIVREDGSVAAWNCSVRRRGNVLEVTPAEECITGLHVNAATAVEVKTRLGGKKLSARVEGMQWIGEKPACERLKI